LFLLFVRQVHQDAVEWQVFLFENDPRSHGIGSRQIVKQFPHSGVLLLGLNSPLFVKPP
jgi:hypothetical protein